MPSTSYPTCAQQGVNAWQPISVSNGSNSDSLTFSGTAIIEASRFVSSATPPQAATPKKLTSTHPH